MHDTQRKYSHIELEHEIPIKLLELFKKSGEQRQPMQKLYHKYGNDLRKNKVQNAERTAYVKWKIKYSCPTTCHGGEVFAGEEA